MKKSTYAVASVIAILAFIIYLFFQATGIFGGDSGDLVTAAFEFGVPHPPGYPLYTWFVWLATRIPLFTPAWRAGLMSSIPHALTLGFVYLIVRRLGSSASAGLFAVLMLGGNYLFFLYSTTPEVFAFLIYLSSFPFIYYFFGVKQKIHYLYLFICFWTVAYASSCDVVFGSCGRMVHSQKYQYQYQYPLCTQKFNYRK